ncbi:MAG: hypothetical protein RIC55_00185 [Pirellulaceae bacterium]
MVRRCLLLLLLCSAILAAPVRWLSAAPPWANFIPFRRIEVDPLNWYELEEEQGPWMVLATTFRGERAMYQAHDLVLELRKRYRLPAYLHARQFDFTQPERGLGVTADGRPKTMRYRNAKKVVEVAVLVGEFESIDDPRAQRLLETIKHARPECMEPILHGRTNDEILLMRARYLTNFDPDKGPMRQAILTPNPMLPDDYFAPKGLDPLVVSINRDVSNSLFDCPGKYSVKVATFRGKSSMPLKKLDGTFTTNDPSSKLIEAAEKAHLLTQALRDRGVEAYEFHDLQESVVTIGSFSSVGHPRADGKTEINPAVHRIMQEYGAERPQLANGREAGLLPRSLEGIQFDIQPVPIEVPRPGYADGYAQAAYRR